MQLRLNNRLSDPSSNSCGSSLILFLQNMELSRLCRTAVAVVLAGNLLVSLGLTAAAAPTESASGSGEPTTQVSVTISEEPIPLLTIENPQCQLHRRGQTKSCGMRQLDAEKGSGVVFWNPKACNRLHCQCQATKEVRREKRTIANNKTTIEYKRFRIYECL